MSNDDDDDNNNDENLNIHNFTDQDDGVGGETLVELSSRHRRERKQLDGEQRAALKKSKSNKKTAKQESARIEAEYEVKLQEMEARHGQEIAVTCGEETTNTAMDATTTSEPLTQTTSPTSSTIDNNTDEKSVDNEINPPSNTRLTKSQKKRAAARDKALQQQGEQQVLELHASSQSSPKRLEQEALESILTPLGLCICDVAADGNCLYRSIAVATTSTSTGSPDYRSVRALCADALACHEEDFAPFCEYDDEDNNNSASESEMENKNHHASAAIVSSFDSYVRAVRESSRWGGHLELRALSLALQRPIHVYSASSTAGPLVIDASTQCNDNAMEPIRLSYHLHYYALGEHYNSVVPITNG